MESKKLFLLIVSILLLASCFKDEKEIEYAKVYFPLAARSDANGVFNTNFSVDKDTTFIIGAYCSGSIITPEDVRVKIDFAYEEFSDAQASVSALAGYELMPEEALVIEPGNMEVVIAAGKERADLKVTFYTAYLTAGHKYVLPVKISSVSLYEITEKNSVLFFGVNAK